MTGARNAILFVCYGNICRSPLAEAAMRARAEAAGLDIEIDSAGTGDWHVDEPPDRRAQATARAHGLDISAYRGRQIAADDFHRFTHIFAMDGDNLASIRGIAPHDATARIGLLLDEVGELRGQSVGDPYHGGDDGFETTWKQVDAAAEVLIGKLA